MKSTSWLIVPVLVVVGCSSPMAGADSGITDVATSTDTGATDAASTTDVVGDAATLTCGATANTGASLVGTDETGAAPTPAGGTLSDGVYRATQVGYYGGEGSGTIAATLAVRGAAWEFEVNQDGTVISMAGTFTNSGTSLVLTTTCNTSSGTSIPSIGYTAVGDTLTLFLAQGPTTAVFTLTRQ